MAVTRTIDVTPAQKKTILSLLKKYLPNTTAWVYGSRAKWTARPSSDLDLVVFATNEQSAQVGDLREAFEESNLPFHVDLFIWDDVPEEFHKNIKAEHVVLTEKASARSEISFGDAVTLMDCAELVRDTVSPTNFTDHPYIGLEHIEKNSLHIMGHGLSCDVTSPKTKFQKGDVLFGKLRPYFRKVVRAPFEGIASTDIWVIRPREGADARYLFYLMATNDFVDFATRGAEGTRMPRAKWDFVSKYKFFLPDIKKQREIAHILGTLDDKIELNHKMNATLEEMSRALFKSWFVDFDPVHAKAKGRDTGLPKEIEKFFVGKFKKSKHGDVPSNWKISTLEESFDLTMGQSPPGDSYNELGEGTAFYQGQRDFGVRFPSERVFSTKPTRYANRGDTLVSVRAPVGTVNMASARCAIGRGVAAVRHKSKAMAYTFYMMKFLEPRFSQFEQEGTVFGSINKKNFENLPVIAPTPNLLEAFEELVAPIESRLRTNAEAERTLRSIRDTLLPTLISGGTQPRAERKAP